MLVLRKINFETPAYNLPLSHLKFRMQTSFNYQDIYLQVYLFFFPKKIPSFMSKQLLLAIIKMIKCLGNFQKYF